MKVAEVAALIGIAGSTVRNWSLGEWKRYLSPTGQGGEGTVRNLTEQDARILHLISVRKNQGEAAAAIHAELQAFQADDWHRLPPLPAAPANVAPVPMVPSAAAEASLSAHTHALLREIADLRERLELSETKRETQQETITELRERLAEALLQVKLYESGRLKPPGN